MRLQTRNLQEATPYRMRLLPQKGHLQAMEALGTAIPIWAHRLARGNDSGRLVSSSVVVQELEYVRGGGGKSPIKPHEKLPPGYKAVGILYVRQVTAADQVEMEVRYESHVTDAVKVAIAERFGVGAREWKVSE